MRKKSVVLSTVIVVLAMGLTACSSTSGYKGVYDSKRDDRPLEVPPDLSTPDVQSSLQIPQLASQQGGAQASGSNQVAPLHYGKARLVRESSLRWLEVAMPIDQVWSSLQAFFRGLGFKFVREDQALGVLETDWQENRFDVPTSWLSRLFSKLYDTGLMDSYRIRLERSADEQHTLVFIAHRGLKEAFAEDYDGLAESKGWTVRAADPELENEMLLRFAINLGGDKAALERQRAEVS
ncbi:MAG: outer membrane protein assembly factor BamC, partial [Gammaproteobacteria bacterium]